MRCRFHGRTHDHLTARSTRHCAANQQQIAFGIDAHDLQIFDRPALAAHVTGHALTGEHAAWRLALTDRTGRTMRYGHTVRRRQTAEVVTLHDAGVALTGRRAGDIDDLADA